MTAQSPVREATIWREPERSGKWCLRLNGEVVKFDQLSDLVIYIQDRSWFFMNYTT